jgi:uncharacterized protein (TIGR03118 family)
MAGAAAFTDPALPPGYAAFNIQSTNFNAGQVVHVTYAQRDPHTSDQPTVGAGLGLVDVFDTDGNFARRLVSPGGALNAPWGITVAPGDFGGFSNSLLVANSGDGRINAYDPNTGQWLGALKDSTSTDIVVPGLHAITFGSNVAYPLLNNVLFYSAAPGGAAHGTIGTIQVKR